MTFTIKTRGASSAPIVAEYRCADHGVFEQIVDRPAPDDSACPECGASSPWTVSAVRFKPQYASVVQGKVEPPPTPMALDTQALADGMSTSDWKTQRAKMRREQRLREIREKT